MAMEEKRRKVWLLLLAGCCIEWGIYFLTAKVLESKGLEYRSWICLGETVVLIFAIPISGFAVLGYEGKNGQGRMGKQGRRYLRLGKTALRGLCVVAIVFGCLFLLIFGDCIFEKERQLTKDVLEGTTKYLFSDRGVQGNYYRSYGLLVKRKYDYYEEPVVLAVLGRRYGQEMEAAGYYEGEKADGVPYSFYELRPKGEEDILFHVIPLAGIMPGYPDDYKEARAIKRAGQYESEHGQKRLVETEDSEYGVFKQLGVVCHGEEDMEECAQETAGMIEDLLEDAFFQDYGIRISMLWEDGESSIWLETLEVGNVYGTDGGNAGDYADKENVYRRLEALFHAN